MKCWGLPLQYLSSLAEDNRNRLWDSFKHRFTIAPSWNTHVQEVIFSCDLIQGKKYTVHYRNWQIILDLMRAQSQAVLAELETINMAT